MKDGLIKKLAVTFELCSGRQPSEAMADTLVADLEAYSEEAVSSALDRCRREIKGHLALRDIIERIDDGRPGAQEAWAMIPADESGSVVWTDEMAEAYGVVRLMTDRVAARMSFVETYQAAVTRSRSHGLAVRWSPSLGTDPGKRDGVLIEAVEKGRLSAVRAQGLLSAPESMPARLLPSSKPERHALPEPKQAEKLTEGGRQILRESGLGQYEEVER